MSKTRKACGTALLTVAAVGAFASPASATVHEITAAYCSGGGHGNFEGNAVEPPGLGTFGSKNFAKRVIASGAVVLTATGPQTTDAPQVKVLPGLDAASFELTGATIDHPSEHCAALR